MPYNHSCSAELGIIAQKLLAYCHRNDWSGYDPYDALNSRLMDGRLQSSLPRLVVTQLLKRSPVNFRPLLHVPKTQNPKAIALFLAALLKAPDMAGEIASDDLIDQLAGRLLDLRSTGRANSCWGYSFPWQTRTVIVPRGQPNLVCTSFVASAVLDLYEQRFDPQYLEVAVSGADYIVNDLYWTNGDRVAGFSYPLPTVRNQIHNGNLLAAALLCRIYKHTGETRYLEPALRAARYSVTQQQPDGSWFYGEGRSQRWIDNFHSGYNLCALRRIDECLESGEFEGSISKGFAFYKKHFVREDGAARYFHNRTYPIDIHCVAQTIITLATFDYLEPSNLPSAHKVFDWARKHMWNDEGFFAYRVLRFGTIWTSYMRWSQAWMLLAMAILLSRSRLTADGPRYNVQRAPNEVPA